MTAHTDPVSRALFALERLRDMNLDPVVAAAWDEAMEALLEAKEEREAFVTVTLRASDLLNALADYNTAFDAGDAQQIAQEAEACEAAEEALWDALAPFTDDDEQTQL